MTRDSLTLRIEQAIARESGLNVIVELRGGALSLDGVVGSEEDRQAAEDIAEQHAGALQIQNNLEVEGTLPTSAERFAGSDPDAELVWSRADVDADDELDADFLDQPFLGDANAAAGAHGDTDTDEATEGDEVWVPPSDPVIGIDARGEGQVLGGFGEDALEDLSVERSAEDRRPGDEALADAVRRGLREDAATTDLEIFVAVRNGIVHLRGRVEGLEDADAAEEVAGRVPGIVEVREELDVDSA
jgi:osmotically-inducible protein OsmY